MQWYEKIEKDLEEPDVKEEMYELLRLIAQAAMGHTFERLTESDAYYQMLLEGNAGLKRKISDHNVLEEEKELLEQYYICCREIKEEAEKMAYVSGILDSFRFFKNAGMLKE